MVVRRRLKKQRAGYGSELHQNVAYVHRLRITLVHAQNVKVSFDSYFNIIGFVEVEIFALLRGDILVGRALGGTAH